MPKLHNDRFEAVMAARSAADPQSQAAKRQRHIIKHHKNLGRLDLVKLRYLQERVSHSGSCSSLVLPETHRGIWPSVRPTLSTSPKSIQTARLS